MDKTAKVINCGPLKDNRMLCGTITVGGKLTNRIDKPQQIYNVNNNGKMYLFEQYGVPCHLLEYIGIYLTEPLQSSAPPLIITYSQDIKDPRYPHIPMFTKGYQTYGRNMFLQYEDKVVGYTFIHGNYSFNNEYMFTHILKINNKTHRLENLYTNKTYGDDIKDFPSLEKDLNQVFASSND